MPKYKEGGDPLEVKEAFSEELRVLIARKNWTATEVAKRIGIDPGSLSRLQNTQYSRIPDRSTLLKWGEKLNLTWNEELPLFVSAQMLPRLPRGFGRNEAFLLGRSFEEILIPGSPAGFYDLFRKRMDELWAAQLKTPQSPTI